MRRSIVASIVLLFMAGAGFAEPADELERFIDHAAEADLVVLGTLGEVCFRSGFRSGDATIYVSRSSAETEIGRSVPVSWMGERRMTREIVGTLDAAIVALLREQPGERWVLLDLLEEREVHSERFADALASVDETPGVASLTGVIGTEPIRRPPSRIDDESTLEVVLVEPLPLTAVSADDVLEFHYHYVLDPSGPLTDYSLRADFETTGPDSQYLGGGPRVTFSEREGRGVLRLPLRDALRNPDPTRPLQVRLYLSRETSARTGSTVASSDLMEWSVVE